jgi:hypothetical protein
VWRLRDKEKLPVDLPYAFQPRTSNYQDYAVPAENADCARYFRGVCPIVMILESPHEHEYGTSDGRLVPRAPAQGATGRSIETLVDWVQRKNIASKSWKHPFIITNPVPWQCSMFHLHERPLESDEGKRLRNWCWRLLWRKGHCVQRSFLSHLNEYYRNGVLINACTSEFSNEVGEAICDHRRVITCYHPSSPSFTKPYVDRVVAAIQEAQETSHSTFFRRWLKHGRPPAFFSDVHE